MNREQAEHILDAYVRMMIRESDKDASDALRDAEETQHAQRAGEITPETIRAARGGVADEIGRIPETAAESAARADSVPLVDVSRDTRERIEADAWEAARLDMSRTWEERRNAIVALLDRQAALTEREWGSATANERIVELRKKVNALAAERDELRAKLDAYNQTHMELPVDADGVPIREGDVVQFVNDAGGTGAAVEVCAISEHYVYYGEGKHFYRAANCRHVKPRRSLEDVLATFRFDAKNIYDDPMLNGNERVDELDALDADVAAEIRELMGW